MAIKKALITLKKYLTTPSKNIKNLTLFTLSSKISIDHLLVLFKDIILENFNELTIN